MWALRRASNPIKNRVSSSGISRLCCTRIEKARSCLDGRPVFSEPSLASSLPLNKYFHATCISSNCSTWERNFSSQVGARSSGEEDDLEDGFSELETSVSADVVEGSDAENENEDDLISEPEFSEDEDSGNLDGPSHVELELSDTEVEASEKKTKRKRVTSELFKTVIAAAPGQSILTALDKWVEDGKDLSGEEIALTMLNLRKRRMYGRALELSEWLEKSKKLEFHERDYASRVDLIAKVRGIYKAEHYIEKIPKSFRGEVIYRTLLANCVSRNNLKKAEEIFNKMKDLEFPTTCFACNQLLLLYKRIDKKKIADVILLMEKENIKPSLFTYRILIDSKGKSNDINGMENIVEMMKAEGIEPDRQTLSIIAKHYVSGGLKEKAEATLKEMEGGNIKDNRWVCQPLLPLYAALGKTDEVKRVWKVCQSNPRLDECVAAIEAWGKLKNIEEAEAVFDKMLKTWKKLSSKHYSALLKVYAENKKLAKGKDLIKRMGDSGCWIGPLTWDALVKLYVESGEVEKADSILHKAAQQKQLRPMFNSYMLIMDQYAKRGDIHNSEKMFHRMRQSGYEARHRQFQALIQAYINAKSPAYGIRERMKADNIFPNKALAGQLVLVDAFRKTTVSDLLD